jgi:hypothetical protein
VDPDLLQSGSGYGSSILAQSGSGYGTRSTKALSPDPVRIRIRIYKGICEDNILKYKLKVKITSSLYYFVPFSYKNDKKLLKGTFFLIFFICPWMRDPYSESGSGSRIRMDPESWSTTLLFTPFGEKNSVRKVKK